METGKQYKVIAQIGGHGFNIGEIVTAFEKNEPDDESWPCEAAYGVKWWLLDSEVEALSAEESQERTFTLEQMREIFIVGISESNLHISKWNEIYNSYMKSKFNIDIK